MAAASGKVECEVSASQFAGRWSEADDGVDGRPSVLATHHRRNLIPSNIGHYSFVCQLMKFRCYDHLTVPMVL